MVNERKQFVGSVSSCRVIVACHFEVRVVRVGRVEGVVERERR